ncbi:MAG: hypothetical protein KAR44_02945 [Candidatus Aegiribacteria sp.]|nr:hypothetical protein [Candidatus Aegiribacteria sp.]
MKCVLFTALICSITLTVSASMSEETILADYGDLVFRPDSVTLCILTAEGDTLVFADRPYSEDIDISYAYEVISWLPQQNYWILQIYGHEWQETLLVNGVNGRIDRTISSPVPSPDGTRFLCFNGDQVACFDDNGVHIWRIDADSLALEFSDLDVAWEPRKMEWISDSVIVFEKLYYYWRTYDEKHLPGRLELSSDGTWIPEDPESWE